MVLNGALKLKEAFGFGTENMKRNLALWNSDSYSSSLHGWWVTAHDDNTFGRIILLLNRMVLC
jgi:hypothetical protein